MTTDALLGDENDLRSKAMFNRRKKEAKDRLVYYSHYAPPVKMGEFVHDPLMDQGPRKSSDDPRLLDSKVGPLLPAEVHMIVGRTLSLCRIHHAVGDAFSVVFPYPWPVMDMEQMQELLALPGVFSVTYDHCAYGRFQRNRQILITNQSWLAKLSRDCQSDYCSGGSKDGARR